jgi:hypothetical protein
MASIQASDSKGKAEFTGFANDERDKKGKRVDPREVPAFEDTSEEGQIRKASQTTESSLVAFRTEGPGTNGAPAAVVPDPDAKQENPDPDAPAEGQGANGS